MPTATSAVEIPTLVANRSLVRAGAPMSRPDQTLYLSPSVTCHGDVAAVSGALAGLGIDSPLTAIQVDASSGTPAPVRTRVTSNVQRIKSKQSDVVTAYRVNGVGGVPPRGRPN